jgi:hypothetical protein
MSAVKGTYQLLFKELRWYFTIFSTITLALASIYLLISVIFNVPDHTKATLFGPIYGGICAFAIAGLIIPFQVAIGLGSTRKQFMKSYYAMSVLMVVASITFLNALYLFMHFLLEAGINKFQFFHPGFWDSSNYHFFTYYWFDLMIGLFILGMASFISVMIRRLGIINFLILLVLMGIGLTMVTITGNWYSIFKWIMETKVMYTSTCLGLFGIMLLLFTYPMMMNAPLTMKSRRG